MLAASGPLTYEITPPIIVDENGDVWAYQSVAAVVQDVEVVDVLDGAYTFHDSTGRLLEARVHNGKVTLVPTSILEAESETLRSHMIGMLRFHGEAPEGISAKPFGELARLIAEKQER